MLRLFLGFVVAAVWLPVSLLLYSPAGQGELPAVLVAMLAVPLTVFAAAPLYWVLRRRVNLIVCICSGAIVGVFGCLLFWLGTNWLATVNTSPAILITALVSSLIFWAVAIWNNKRLAHRTRAVGEEVA
jgi:uncharacterized membrane protein YeiH